MWVLAASFAGLPLACKDVSTYSTKPGESYCGNIVQGAFVRAGFAPDTTLRLTFDADAMTTRPGSITTSDGLLVAAPLRPVAPMFQDPISTMQFGEGRRKNLFYVVDPARPGERVNAVVSLMESGDVEVRLFRADAPIPPGTAVPASDPSLSTPLLFGVFPLSRQPDPCGR